MLKKSSLDWNARQMKDFYEAGEITFDNPFQRSLVWKEEDKSLFIHSMMTGYDTQPLYIEDLNNKYDVMDGKQRINCALDFMNDKFKLVGLEETEEVTLKDGNEVEVIGKVFSELPVEIQDRINTYSFTVRYYQALTDEKRAEIYYRLNNGKGFTSIEHSRLKAKSLTKIQAIGHHKLFNDVLTAKAFAKYTHEDMAIKAWIMLNADTPCLDTKAVRPIMSSVELTDEDVQIMSRIFDRIYEAYNLISSDDCKETQKLSKKIAKRLITRTHLLSVIPITEYSLNKGISIEDYAAWVKAFFCGTTKPTKYSKYNDKASSGSNHAEAIRSRLEVISKDFKEFMKNREIQNATKPAETKTETKKVETVDTVENVETTENEESVETTTTEDSVETTTENTPAETYVQTEMFFNEEDDKATYDEMIEDIFSGATESDEPEEVDLSTITEEEAALPFN